jgi:hypothetical protein
MAMRRTDRTVDLVATIREFPRHTRRRSCVRQQRDTMMGMTLRSLMSPGTPVTSCDCSDLERPPYYTQGRPAHFGACTP